MNTSAQQLALDSLHSAIDEFNETRSADQRLGKAPETVLLGTDSMLDSLALVNLLVTVEERVSSASSTPITLASEKAFSMRNSPFATVGSLTAYVQSLIEEPANG